MNVEFVILRIVHIGAGMIWAGGAVYVAFILVPKLEQLGPAIQRPVMAAISNVTALVLTTSGAITIVAGTYMALRMRWGHLDTWFDTGWGWAIFIGAVMSIIAMGLGGATGATAKRMGALSGSIEGRAPTPEEAGQLQGLAARLNTLSRVSTVLVIIALGTMASARFV